MVVVQIPAGIAMTSEPLARFADPLFILHKGLGAIPLFMVLARVVWRLTHRPPPFPDFMPQREQRIAHRTHMALYALLVAMVVSGYVRTVGDDYPIELLDALGVPPLIPSMPGVAAVGSYGNAGTLHVPGTYVLVFVFFVTFVAYYSVNWKYLSEVWPLS